MVLCRVVEYERGARLFLCKWKSCNKSFNRRTDFERHYRIHTNERPYTCPIPGCRKSFIQRTALTVHIRTHTGEKPYQCQQMGCGKRFCDSSSLARHRRIHTGKRPHKCGHDGCTKTYYRKGDMVAHQRSSHQRGLRRNSILDDCSSDYDMGEASLAPSETTNSRTILTVVPDQYRPENNHLMHGAVFVPDIGPMMQQYEIMQNFGDSSIQQPHHVLQHGNSDISPKSTNLQPPFQVPRILEPPNSVLEVACFTQSMTMPSSSPVLSPATYQSSSIHYNSYALTSTGQSQALHSAPDIQQQFMSQETWQATQLTQANAEHYPSTVGVEQFHTVSLHDLACDGHGQVSEQEDVCVIKPADGGIHGCNMVATVPNYHSISQVAKFDFAKMRDALIWPMNFYKAASDALFDLSLDDGAQCVDQQAASVGEWNRSSIPVAACY